MRDARRYATIPPRAGAVVGLVVRVVVGLPELAHLVGRTETGDIGALRFLRLFAWLGYS